MVQLSNPYVTTGETIPLTRRTFVGKVMSLLFNTLLRFVKAFLPRSKHLLIWWLQSPCKMILEPEKLKSFTVSIFPPSICREVMGQDTMISIFSMLSFNQLFHSLLSPSSRGSLVSLHFLPLGWCHLHIRGCWHFSWPSWLQLVIKPAQHFTWCTLHID